MDDTTLAATPGTETVVTETDTGLDFDIGTGTETDTGTETVEQQPVTEQPPQQPTTIDEPDVKDFAGHVSGRIRNLVKQAPELGQVLTKYPKIRDAIEAPLRREAAYRDVFPTVSEAKAMRERFPNGLQDVAALEEDVKEIEGIDNLTYTKDRDGNYAGHPQLINNIFTSDRNAAVALFKTIPKEWHRLDPSSYNDVMGKIVGATLVGTGSWEQLVELREHAAATEGLKGIVPALDKVLNRLSGFVEERRPDANEERLNRDRQQFDQQRQQAEQQTQQQFNQTFQRENTQLQRSIVTQHKVMQKLATIKSITPQKRAEIVDKICVKVEAFSKGSPAFMRKLTAAHASRNMEEVQKVIRAQWNQDWLLNRMIRDVLKVETPQLVNSNRATVQTRTGTKPPTKATTENGDKTPTGPYQVNNQWYAKDGRRMTTMEAMRHVASLS